MSSSNPSRTISPWSPLLLFSLLTCLLAVTAGHLSISSQTSSSSLLPMKQAIYRAAAHFNPVASAIRQAPSVTSLRMSSSSTAPMEPSQQTQQQATESSPSTSHLDALPAPSDATSDHKIELGEDGSGVLKLDHLGPMVVNQDGTLSRISNWEKMTEIEKKNTVRVIGKRNKQRLEKLKSEEDEAK